MARRHTAPAYLPESQKKAWEGKYDKAFEQAKTDHPDNESAQHTAAHKEANKMLAVTAPTSAEDIDKLQDWQVLQRGVRTINGVEHRVCTTIDGRKYAHPVKKAA